jgi:site-specific DNA recombinase
MKRKPTKPAVRCAVYTRKSTEEGLEQEFNSLDAQREAGEAMIKSQQHEGWECLPDEYDDGGYTGGNMDRPALRRLLADIEAGKIDCVCVYKVDRLSRSLLDFARMMEVFDRHNVSFVSVTQAFNTATSMGRLILNVLLSFAQFEREMISERTRDKIAATRRKGKWSGGMPLLGYDVKDTKLVVNKAEADRVREIFELYVENESLLATVKELNRRGWRTKMWTTKKKKQRGGHPFAKTRLYQLLTNPTYIGKVRYKAEVHAGEHEAIVDAGTFRKVQALLGRNGRSGGRGVRNKHGALLTGLLRCTSCDCAMGHTYSVKGQKRYRYYVCARAQQRGWDECPAPSLPAGEIERFVVDQIKEVGRDPALVAATVAATRRHAEEGIKRLDRERNATERQSGVDEAELRRLASVPAKNGELARLADVQERIGAAERRLTEIADELAALEAAVVTEADVAAALADFDAVWDALTPREQARALALLIEHVDHDGDGGNVSITFRPTGLKTLAGERIEEHAA